MPPFIFGAGGTNPLPFIPANCAGGGGGGGGEGTIEMPESVSTWLRWLWSLLRLARPLLPPPGLACPLLPVDDPAEWAGCGAT